jgi:hypothetical protein
MAWSPDAEKTAYLSKHHDIETRGAVPDEGSMQIHKARLRPIRLPDFGLPDSMPEISPAIYRERVNAARRRAKANGLDLRYDTLILKNL